MMGKSCTVTNVADRKTRNILRRAKKLNEDAVVIVTGCYAQTDGETLSELPEIDYVVGNTDKSKIFRVLENHSSKKETNKLISSNIFFEKEYEEIDFSTLREMSRAYIKIQDGCNEFCAYCKIPFARGRSRSRSIDSIEKEVTVLADEGYKEIILIGINLSAYGEDLPEEVNFEDLLERVSLIKGIERIRLGSIYPDKINDRFINLMQTNPKLMPHLHISLQSCDDKILSLMERKYGSDLIRDKLLALKSTIKDLEFTADVIIGFPQEEEENFENSYNLIKEIGFSDLHIFPYSERENTKAVALGGKVDGNVKKQRVEKLDKLREKMYEETRTNYIGKVLKVLIEENNGATAQGYTENYIKTGNNYSISVNVIDEDEAAAIFAGLSDKGQTIMPFAEAFWGGKFGMLVDQFGVQWMVSSGHKGDEPK